ncbi:MAG: methylenetetrahydrofolate reductase [NAD(P)H] [Firmicutes bacterium]|nr:methylenetetrahydrofolate reductase [NAD(P)H] [[Eubacterium] siraeum]MCM1487972.1 methylenetetrahydrofolate reductase [NAD(P)H] [Bacillota bacterium]
MKTKDIFKKKCCFSFEIFPPKRNMPIESIYNTLEELAALKPDFISVTYGAGGSANAYTIEIASKIKNDYGIESVAHLPCLYLGEKEAEEITDRLFGEGIENVLALRGDKVPDCAPNGRFTHADQLISFIKERKPDLNLLAACYPEGHPESKNKVADLHNLKNKVDCGADHLVSQLFFDNRLFMEFEEKARIAGINVPIEAGIMPVVNKKQIERMVTLCGASLPEKFVKMMNRFENSPEAIRDAGIAYAVDQIADLITRGVDGIHLYTMNNPYIAKRIVESVGSLIQAVSPSQG